MSTLFDLLALGEGSTAEFKRSLRSDLGREICAFAHATGGVILLGVDDEGTLRGVEGHNRLKSQVQSVARSADPAFATAIRPTSQEEPILRRMAEGHAPIPIRVEWMTVFLAKGQMAELFEAVPSGRGDWR